MKQISLFITALALLIVATGGVYLFQQQKIEQLEAKNNTLTRELADARAIDTETDPQENTTPTAYTSEKGVAINLVAPARGSEVASPLLVKGSVPGSWSFEGQFAVRLLDGDGAVLVEQAATLDGDWMTEGMVPFSVTFEFTSPDSMTGWVELVKANPSDLPENSDSLKVPIRF